MITQEMVSIAVHASRFANPRTTAEGAMEDALTAAYPLIRHQVLEDVAKEFELWGHDKLAAQRIRNLKDKTDE